MLYLRVFLAILWSIFSCFLGLFRALFHWGDASLFSPSVHFISWGGLRALGLKTRLKGEAYLNTLPAVMVSNHQSFLDTLLLGSIWPPKVVPVGKREIGFIPILGWWFVGSGARLINRSQSAEAKNILDSQIGFIHQGFGIGITPEGTRNKKGKGLLPFKKGAFHLAIKAQVPIVAFVIAPLGDFANWDKKVLKKAIIPIEVLPPFSTQGLTESDVDSLMKKVRDEMEKTLNQLEKEIVTL